jgi:hypothetical protein
MLPVEFTPSKNRVAVGALILFVRF